MVAGSYHFKLCKVGPLGYIVRSAYRLQRRAATILSANSTSCNHADVQ